MPSHQRNHTAVIRWLLFVCLLCSGSSLEAQIEAPSPVPSQEASSQSKDSSDDSELKLHNYQLKRAKAAEVLKLWKQLHGGENTATVDERTNSIVFLANETNARELRESLALLDGDAPPQIIPPTPVVQGSSPKVPSPAKSKPAGPFRKFTFKHAKVADVVKILRELTGANIDNEDMEGFAVDERTNSVIWKVKDEWESQHWEEALLTLDGESSTGRIQSAPSPHAAPASLPRRVDFAPTPNSQVSAQPTQTFTFSMGFERAESLESLKQRYNEFEQQTHQLANKLKQSRSPSETERKELKAAIRKSFEARQALQRAELADLAGRMKSMQQSIDMRDKLADKVIERRVEDLLDPDLKWENSRTDGPTLADTSGVASELNKPTHDSGLSLSTRQSDPGHTGDYREHIPPRQTQYHFGDPATFIKEKMQGRWIVKTIDMRTPFSWPLEVQIEGNAIHMIDKQGSWGPNLFVDCEDGSSQPKSADDPLPVDLVIDPNGEPKTYRGIVTCDGQTLVLCTAIETAKQNTDFRPRLFVPGSKVTVIECRRAPADAAKAVSGDKATWKSAIQQATSGLLLAYRVPPNIDPNEGPKVIALIGVDYQGKQEAGDLKEEIYEWIEDDVPVASPGRFTLLSRKFVDLAMMETKLRPSDLASSSPSFLENRRQILEHFRRHDVKLDSLLITSLKHIGDSDKTRQNQFEVTLEGFIDPQTSWFEHVTLVREVRDHANQANKSNANAASPSTPAMELRDRLQGAWDVRTFQMDNQGDVRVSQVVIRGDILLVNTIVDGKVLGTSPWKLVWPNSDEPFEIEAIWDPNSKPATTECMPGRIAYDGKSFQIAFGGKRPREICPGEEITYIDCVRATVPTETANHTALSDNDLSRQSSSLPAKHDAKVDLAVFDWSDLLKLLPESGTVLMMFSYEPDKREQMLPIAEKVAEEAAVKLIHLPIDNWRTLFSKEATHFVLMKDRQLIGAKTGLVTEAKLKEFVAQAKDWLTPHSTGVMESSLVRVDCYISPGKDNIGSQHGPAIPITLAAVAIDGDEALLFGTEGIAKYLEKGCACVAIVRDEKGNEKQVPLEVVLTGNVPLKKPDALNDDDALVITIPFFKYDKEYIELQEAYEVGSAIYRIRGAHGLTTVKLAPFDSTPQKGERVLAGEFNSSRHHGPILGFQSPFHWQTQQNLSESDWSIYGGNIHGAKMFQVLCPTIPAPSSFLFNAHGRLIGTRGLGNLTEKDKTYTALMPYAIHSVLHTGLEAIAHVGLKAALKQTLEESTSANQSTKTSATAEPKYSGHPISWWLDSYWDSATAIPKTAENIAQEYVASDAIRKLREKPECKAAIEAALAKWFASVEHEVNEIQLVRAAKCFVTAAGQEYQELAVDYLFKIWKQFPTLSWEKQIERLGEETELNDLLKQIELNDELANKFAERLTNGTSSDRSLVTYYLISSTGLKDEKDPKVAQLNAWLHNHRELFFPAFSAALKDESEHIRWFSLASLIGLDPKHASILSTITSVIESDASPKVRWLAIEMFSSKELLSVAKTQNIEITPLLIQTLQSDSSVDVRYAALEALMAMDNDSELVHATLLEWARCKERLQVEYALYLMLRNHEVGDRPQSIDELIELLSDSEWGTTVEVKQNSYRWARQYAIANLGEYAAHAHRAIPTLEAELARKNKDTLSFATEALDSVRGFCPDLPIDQLQGEWEFVSVNRPSSTTAFFDFPLHPGGVYPGMGREIRTASHELPPTIITVTGTQLKIGDRVVAEISHHRKLGGFVMLLDPDGRKLHCNGSFRIAGGPSPSVGAATSPQKVTLEICELRNEYDSTQATKQTYELQVKELH